MVRFLLATFFLFQLVSPQLIPSLAGVKTSIFAQALMNITGFDSRIKDPTTLFIPTDEAFSLLDPAWVNSAFNHREYSEYIKQVVSYHIVAGRKMAAEFRTGLILTESNDRLLHIDVPTTSCLPMVDKAQVQHADLAGSRGPVHIVNQVLIPGDLACESFATTLRRRFPSTSVFLQAVIASGLLPYFESLNPKLVFVPNDRAFSLLPKGALANALRPENRDYLRYLISYHVVPFAYPAKYPMFNTSTLNAFTLNAQTGMYNPLRYFNRVGRLLTVLPEMASPPPNTQDCFLVTPYFPGNSVAGPNVSVVSAADRYACNARIQILDQMLIPPEMAYLGITDTLKGITNAASFVEALFCTGDFPAMLNTRKNITVFVPTNAAFAKLPPGYMAQLAKNYTLIRQLLNAHVAQGVLLTNAELGLRDGVITTVQTLNPAFPITGRRLPSGKVVLTGPSGTSGVVEHIAGGTRYSEVAGLNGLIHFVDTVFVPPELQPANFFTALNSRLSQNFSTFLTMANLATNAPGMTYPAILNQRIPPITLFAPHNGAFNALPKGWLQDLLKPENRTKLTQIFLHHFVRGLLNSDAFDNRTMITLDGSTFTLATTADNETTHVNRYDELTFNNALVVTEDYPAANGVLHVVDRVIIPRRHAPLDLYQTLLVWGLTEFANATLSTNNLPYLTAYGRDKITLFIPRHGLINNSTVNRNYVTANVLNYMVVGGFLSSELKPVQLWTTVGNKTLNVTRTTSGSYVANGIPFSKVDIIAKNGIIHLVDGIPYF